MTPAQPEASAKAPWIRTIVGLTPLLWSAAPAVAADLAGLAEAPSPANRVTPMMADSATSAILFSLGMVVERRTSIRPPGVGPEQVRAAGWEAAPGAVWVS